MSELRTEHDVISLIGEWKYKQLRRASRKLRNFEMLLCGTDSWSEYHKCFISRSVRFNESTGKYELCVDFPGKPLQRSPYPDYKTGALKRIEKICSENGLHYYIQGDCRGIMLYVNTSPLHDNNYHHYAAIG